MNMRIQIDIQTRLHINGGIMNKPNLVFVNNVIVNPDSPIHRVKYEVLSGHYTGIMFYLKDDCYNKHVIGDFICSSCPYYSSIKRLIKYTLHCIKTTKAIGPVDVIIVNDPLLPGIVGYILKMLTGAKLIVEINTDNVSTMKITGTSWFKRLKSSLVPMVMRFILAKADAVKFVNAILLNKLVNTFDLSGKEVRNFFDFVPSSVFSKHAPEEPPYIFLAGLPYQIKGVDVLIRAFNLISGDFPGVRLKIIGHCEDLSPYKELAGGNPAVEFNRGMPYSEIIQHFEKCLFFVLASRSEGLPRAIIDAMSAGKAVIGARVGGIPELIQDGVNGYLFESENHEMLAEKMRILLLDEKLRSDMGEAGYRLVQEHYTPRRYVEHYKELIDRVLNLA